MGSCWEFRNNSSILMNTTMTSVNTDIAYRMKDMVFDIMLRGVTSLDGIAMELNRQGCWEKEWKVVDVKRLLAGD